MAATTKWGHQAPEMCVTELRRAVNVNVKYPPDFKGLVQEKNVKNLINNFILITYWNDNIWDIFELNRIYH